MDGQAVVQPEQNGLPNGGMFPPGANQYPLWSQGAPQQHRPEMPSTSNGGPMQFQDPSPNFFNGNGMAPPNSAPPSVGYFSQQQAPYYNNMPGMPGPRPPGTPEFQPPPSYNAQMARTAPMNPMQRPFPPQMISRGMSNPQLLSQRNPYVFTSEMLNSATQEVKQGRYPSLVQWHQARQLSQPNPIMNSMMDNGQRNSPSFPSVQQPNRSLKRKNTTQSEHNPTPSPQSQMQNMDFKQPMSNQNPQQDVKQELNTADENNPLKKMEIMASFSNEPPAKNIKTEVPNGKSKEEKMAKLDELQRSLQQQPHQYHPAMRYGFPPNGYPPNQMPPQFMNGQNFMPQGFNPQMQNGMPQGGMPPTADPSQMGQYSNPQMNGGPVPQNGFQGHMNSPRFAPAMGGMMGMGGNDQRTMAGGAYQPGMDMGIQRPQNPQEQYAWNQNMPQPLTNLDSRVPNQKMQYYGNGQPPMGGPMPPPASSSTT